MDGDGGLESQATVVETRPVADAADATRHEWVAPVELLAIALVAGVAVVVAFDVLQMFVGFDRFVRDHLTWQERALVLSTGDLTVGPALVLATVLASSPGWLRVERDAGSRRRCQWTSINAVVVATLILAASAVATVAEFTGSRSEVVTRWSNAGEHAGAAVLAGAALVIAITALRRLRRDRPPLPPEEPPPWTDVAYVDL